jgi:ornithine cyclodeaminase/alanine dehydrogenase-like protein (mu-crystallin family)
MALYFDSRDIAAVATDDVTLRAAWLAVRAEQAGTTVLPSRLDVNLPRGFLRVMPAALDSVMGVKVMTLVRGVGNRYLLLLYEQESGELVAVFDASELTRLRTAAITAVAGQLLSKDANEELGLVGSGFEAEGHLRVFARMWPIRRVRVYSPSRERRETFARRLSEELAIEVQPVASSEEAVERAPVSVIATKSEVPVIDGGAFPTGGTVLSIGSTRPDLRELDAQAFARASVVLVDSPAQVAAESGDVLDAVTSGVLDLDLLVPMCEAVDRDITYALDGERDLRVFKSAGTALQDLALASEVLAAASETGIGRELGTLAELKLSANPRTGAPVIEGTP